MRLALKIAYDGTLYHGYARQEGMKTVESTILETLEGMGAMDGRKARLQVASRTDRGVSAAGNIIAFDTSMEADSVVSGIVHSLRGIWIGGSAMVEATFNPRHAKSKNYRYYLHSEGIDIGALEEAAEVFVGKHDFTNFARLDGRNPVRVIHNAEVHSGKIIKIDFDGRSFLWNQVRRMVAAAEMVGRGEADTGQLKRALDGERMNFGIAPPENLLLMGVAHQDVDFQRIGKSAEFASPMLRKMEVRISLMDDIINAL
jgi:tRNA pseudouridine38-40 synthase